MRPKAKYAVIHRHRGEYPISVMCKFVGVSRSGYYCFKKRLGETDRDAVVAKEIEECQRRTDKTYGYRRVWKWLKGRNIQRDPKTVLRIMKKYGIVCPYRKANPYRRMMKASKEHTVVSNLINREFKQDIPYKVLLTDSTQIRKSVEQTVPGGQAKREMGHGHFLHPHKRRHFISVHDPRSV